MTTRFAAAKINLALHVTGRREDGYHLLDSAVMFAADAGDLVTVAPAGKPGLSITGPFSEGLETDGNNLVLKAVEALNKVCARRLRPCHITLEKRLPVASGIGGGSADAAAALNALMAFNEIDVPADQLAAIALELGADVPVCLASLPAACVALVRKSSPGPTRLISMQSWSIRVWRFPPLQFSRRWPCGRASRLEPAWAKCRQDQAVSTGWPAAATTCSRQRVTCSRSLARCSRQSRQLMHAGLLA
jgi:hypothetical protein